MANKALLFWCAGSVAICGSAALATTSLWRAPTSPVGIAAPGDGNVGRDALAEAAGAEITAPSDAIPSLAEMSFFEPRAAGASSLFRGSLAPETESAAAVTTAPTETQLIPLETTPGQGLAEASPEGIASPDGASVSVLPPPRPRLQLARVDVAQSGDLREAQDEQSAPGLVTPSPAPQTAPSFSWDQVFRPEAAQPTRPERPIHAGIASWYGPGFHGRKTASGERFDQNDMTAAHKTLPFGTRVKVIDERTGRSIVVRINDRGPFKPGRVIDLSKQAAQALGMGGLANVKLVSAN